MKKFVVLANIGNYSNNSMECTVKDVELIAESDDRMELIREYGVRPIEYRNNGKWYSYYVEKRADARRMLKQFGKLQ